MAEIMDVSRYQGTIDWEKVKASGKVDGVIIRAMGNSATGRPSAPYTDPQFSRNYRECKRLGAVSLPATERMQAEMDELNAKKATLKAELQKAQREERDYAAIRRNVEDFLPPGAAGAGAKKRMWNWNKSVFCVLSWAFVRTSNIIAL